MARKPATMVREAITKQERVYRALRERIQSGAYEPGDRIVIAQLAAEFGVSALPVREAVRRIPSRTRVPMSPRRRPSSSTRTSSCSRLSKATPRRSPRRICAE
jgi:DNA-binding GntR family transcriptional regulator